MCTGVKVSWALSSSDGARERKMNPVERCRKVAPPQNHGGRKTEAKQRHYKTVVLPSFFCLHLHAPPTVPVQPPVFLVIPKVPAYPAVSPGRSGEVSGFGAWRPGPDLWPTGRSFAHGSHGRGGFLRLLPISDLIGAGDKAGKRKWDGVTDQNWKGMTEIMKKLGKGIIYIFIDLHVLFI